MMPSRNIDGFDKEPLLMAFGFSKFDWRKIA